MAIVGDVHEFGLFHRPRLQAERNAERLQRWLAKLRDLSAREALPAQYHDARPDDWMSRTYRLVALRLRRDG